MAHSVTMRACEQCSTPVGDTWEHCLRCGEELPPAPEPAPRALPRVRLPRVGGAWPLRVPTARRIRGARVPAWLFAGVAAAALVTAAVALSGIASAGPDPAVAEARDTAEAEVARLSAVLAATERTRDRAAADLAAAQGQLTTLEAQVASNGAELETLRAEATSLQAELESTRAELETASAAAEGGAQRVAALTECLDGTQVAFQFAREGLVGAADLALQAVAESCSAARE